MVQITAGCDVVVPYVGWMYFIWFALVGSPFFRPLMKQLNCDQEVMVLKKFVDELCYN